MGKNINKEKGFLNYSSMFAFPKNCQKLNKRCKHLRSCFIVLLCLAVQSEHFGQERYFFTKNKEIDSIISSYKEKEKLKILNLLPSISFDAINTSFNISFSLSSLSNYYQNKHRNKIELAKLEQTLKDQLKNDLEKIDLKIEEYYYKEELLATKIELFKIDFDLFQIKKGKYENAEITIEDFLTFKKSYLTKKNNLKSELFRLDFLIKKLKNKIQTSFFISKLDYLKSEIEKF